MYVHYSVHDVYRCLASFGQMFRAKILGVHRPMPYTPDPRKRIVGPDLGNRQAGSMWEYGDVVDIYLSSFLEEMDNTVFSLGGIESCNCWQSAFIVGSPLMMLSWCHLLYYLIHMYVDVVAEPGSESCRVFPPVRIKNDGHWRVKVLYGYIHMKPYRPYISYICTYKYYRTLIGLLREKEVRYGCFNILADEEVVRLSFPFSSHPLPTLPPTSSISLSISEFRKKVKNSLH